MLILVFIAIFLGAMGQIAMKNGMNGVEISTIFDLPKIVSNMHVWLGLSLYGVSVVFWLVALTHFDISYMYPLVSMGYVLTAVFAYVFLHESIGLYRWFGIVLIIGGVLFIVRS